MELRQYQQAAVDAVYEHLRSKTNNPCIVLPTGCHAKNHPILMYDRTVKKVQDVKIGDQLMGPDSKPRNVLALARGREKMAKIIPIKGNPFVVNMNHLLPIMSNNIKCIKCVKDLKSTHKIYLCQIVNGKENHIPFKIEYLKKDNFYGFSLDSDHLYLDANGFIHHNTGKSVVIAKIVQDAVENWNGRVLILAHVKELLEQNASKIKALCPKIPIGIFSAGLKSKDTQENVIVAGIQSVYNKACDLGSFDIVMVDECFIDGTLIDTPRGDIPIEDLYVGQPVRHALGVGNIQAISSKPTKELIKLELSNGKTIECTPNHPFFTEYGWQKAETLEMGSYLFSRKDLSCLQEYIQAQNTNECTGEIYKLRRRSKVEQQNYMFHAMFSDFAETKKSTKSKFMVDKSTFRNKKMPMLRQGNSPKDLQKQTNVPKSMEFATFLFNILLKESRESNVFSWHCRKSINEVKGNWASTSNTGWQRKKINQSSTSSVKKIECSSRVCSNNNRTATNRWSSKLLQTGCCVAPHDVRDTARWEHSSIKEYKKCRQAQKKIFSGVRVVNITRVKLKSPRIVYNLQVEGHPSYYANGVLVHNCHLIASDGDGMYRTFLKDMKIINPNVRLIGLTATPFRLKGGLICNEDNLLNEVCYEVGLKEMIQQGYLSPLISRAGKAQAKLDNLHIRGGEFISSEIADVMDKDELTNSICQEIVELTKDRKSVLIFTSNIEHCRHVAEKIAYWSGQECAIVTGDTPPHERAELLQRFKGEKVQDDFFSYKPPLKFLANVSVLTTGFDAPNIDCVVMIRPTASAGLLIQVAGRGTRLSPQTGKTDCLFLDYGENILRHGPLDMITVKDKTSGKGEAPAKKCPECLALIHAAYAKCPECNFEFPPSEKSNLTNNASNAGVLSGQVTYEPYDVENVFYALHEKKHADANTPRTMRVDYQVGFGEYKSEWVCPEHTGYARRKFEKWWREHSAIGAPVPTTAREAVQLANEGVLAEVSAIIVKTVAGEKFERISSVVIKEKPVLPDGFPFIGVGENIDEDDEVPF